MDFDLDRANKRKEAERAKRKQAARAKLERERKIKQQAEENQRRVEELALQRKAERLRVEREQQEREEQEHLRTGGVKFCQLLKPRPLEAADTDRIVLPVSALDTCMAQNALEVNPGPLVFELTLVDASGRPVGDSFTTHAGVSEFTAEEGTVSVPIKTAMSLTKDKGLDFLAAGGHLLQVKYVRLESHQKSFARVQPRGHGFHEQGKDVVNIDLKSVLERTLRKHMTLTQGDWLPIRHEGTTYELIVRHVDPAEALLLINTDMEVDIMPSEDTEQQLAREEAEERAAQVKMQLASEMLQFRHRQAASKTAVPEEAATGEHGGSDSLVAIRARMPSGETLRAQFPRSAKLCTVMDWLQASSPDAIPPMWEDQALMVSSCTCGRLGNGATPSYSGHRANCAVEYGFFVVQSWPGHRKEFHAQEHGEKTLRELGLNGRQESLFVSWISPSDGARPQEEPMSEDTRGEASRVAGDRPDDSASSSPSEPSGPSAWADAADKAVSNLDDELFQDALKQSSGAAATTKQIESAELVELFKRVVGSGVLGPPQAAAAVQSYGSQLIDLESMGFANYARNVELLGRYQGRLTRVVNLLAEDGVTDQQNTDAEEGDMDVDQEHGADVADEAVRVEDGSQLSSRALAMLNEHGVQDAAQVAAKFGQQINELADMGFTDVAKMVQLLVKYNGRMERVANLMVE